VDCAASEVAQRVLWRWCGTFFLLPAEEADRSAEIVREAARRILEETGRAVWEVNVWAFAERRLGWRWYPGDHNASIFSCVDAALAEAS
jgi:hypothetical protein